MSVLSELLALKEHIGFMRYFKNTSWLLSEKILRMIAGLFIGVLVARYLGPERFGLLSYAQSFVGLFAAVSTLGLNGIVVRELVKHPERSGEILGTAFALRLSGAFVMLGIVAFASGVLVNDKISKLLILIIASAAIFQSFYVVESYYHSRVESRYIVYINTVTLLISSIVKILLVVFDMGLIAFGWVILFDSSILAAGYLILFLIKDKEIWNRIRMKADMAMELIRDSWPLLFGGLVVAIYMKIDQVMIKMMLNAEAVGQYAAATRLSTAWYFLPTVISSSLFPAIINAKKKDSLLYNKRLQSLYDLMIIISIPIAVATTILADPIIALLFGDSYAEATGVLKVSIWSGIFVFIGVASTQWFISENLQLYSFYRTAAGAIVNILLNWILIPIYSIYGAAIATLISQAVASYLFNAFNRKTSILFKMQTKAFFIFFRKLRVRFE